MHASVGVHHVLLVAVACTAFICQWQLMRAYKPLPSITTGDTVARRRRRTKPPVCAHSCDSQAPRAHHERVGRSDVTYDPYEFRISSCVHNLLGQRPG